MMKTLKIANSNYEIQYDEQCESNYKIMRHDEDVTEELNFNIVFDLFSMVLEQQKEIKNLQAKLQ